jgi:hypothetical protein
VSLSSGPSAIAQNWWALTRGDVDATITQVGAIVAQLFIPVLLLAPVGISPAFSLTHFLPGFALGFLVGSLGLVYLGVLFEEGRGVRTSRRTYTETMSLPSLPTH